MRREVAREERRMSWVEVPVGMVVLAGREKGRPMERERLGARRPKP